MKFKPTDPAIPHLFDGSQRINESEHWPGLTIRAEFAKAAMQALIVNNSDKHEEIIANQAVRYADFLIAELNKGEK